MRELFAAARIHRSAAHDTLARHCLNARSYYRYEVEFGHDLAVRNMIIIRF